MPPRRRRCGGWGELVERPDSAPTPPFSGPDRTFADPLRVMRGRSARHLAARISHLFLPDQGRGLVNGHISAVAASRLSNLESHPERGRGNDIQFVDGKRDCFPPRPVGQVVDFLTVDAHVWPHLAERGADRLLLFRGERFQRLEPRAGQRELRPEGNPRDGHLSRNCPSSLEDAECCSVDIDLLPSMMRWRLRRAATWCNKSHTLSTSGRARPSCGLDILQPGQPREVRGPWPCTHPDTPSPTAGRIPGCYRPEILPAG